MIARDIYQEWLGFKTLNEDERAELLALGDEEVEDRFYQDLSFGTAGLRGKLGLGTNRMNERVIARASMGLANTIKARGQASMDRGVAIAWDVRIKSFEFMKVAASVLASQGIKVYIFDGVRPTPMLSFAVRDLNTQAGIVITASHNPKEYNGYKVYWEEGSQIIDEIANEISEEIGKLSYDEVEVGDFSNLKEKGIIEVIGEDLEERYYNHTLSLAIHEDIDKSISTVYTPLNGTGNIPVRRVLKDRGFTNITVVPEQEEADGTFPTIDYPNPEDVKAFEYGLSLAKNIEADLIIATDPDCDRVAMMGRKKDGSYYAFNGNQTGALLVHYILSQRAALGDLPSNGAVIKSIVTGDLGAKIAEKYGVKMFNTLTGFKNICALPNEWDKTGEYKFIFGYEESIGYTYGDHVRDKDAVVSSMMIVEMAAFYKKQGLNLYEVLENIYREYKFHKEKLISVVKEGISGQKIISKIMEELRSRPITEIHGLKIGNTFDYNTDQSPIGKSNVLEYQLEDGSRFFVRPSGTEPKIKLYIYTEDSVKDVAEEKIHWIEEYVLGRFNQVNEE